MSGAEKKVLVAAYLVWMTGLAIVAGGVFILAGWLGIVIALGLFATQLAGGFIERWREVTREPK